MNRSQLRLSIMAWLHRSSLRTPVSADFDPTVGFIALCEEDLNARLRARCMIIRARQQVDSQYSSLPCDFLEPVDFRLAGGGPPLTYVTRETTANAYWQATNNNPDNMADAIGALPPDYYPIVNPPAYPWGDGTPRRFTVIGNEIEWSPFPTVPEGAASPPSWPVVEMAYYQRLNLGPEDADTNNVLSTHPAAYIYGSLIHSAPFIRDDGRVAVWQRFYDNAVAGANAEAERARTQNSPIRQTYRRLA